MPPTENSRDGMLCLSRHDNCPWDQALKSADLTWTGLQYTCLKILHLYAKVFEREDVLEMVIRCKVNLMVGLALLVPLDVKRRAVPKVTVKDVQSGTRLFYLN
ncbi:unnamed protein product [Euphydryas editha]|uniref:Uncharacterized protein n=1 Tax=Euphydryas editha TaxID=104508 RepID=A0AAU9V6Q4_EUPED|nr:unnamed protein product [Euphydryas editha]